MFVMSIFPARSSIVPTSDMHGRRRRVSTKRSSRGPRSTAPSSRGPRSTAPSSRAPYSSTRGSRAPRSAVRISKAPRSTTRGSRAPRFNGAQLGRASLSEVQLQGAWLMLAQLQGAWFYNAQLQGASLNYTQLQGAFLDGAQLQGASLNKAQLQGAWLDYAQLQGASFVGVCAWRADARQATWKDTRVAHPETGPEADKIPECDWTAASFVALKRLIVEEIPEGDTKSATWKRIEQRLDPTKALEGEDEMAKIWAVQANSSPAPEVYEKSRAGQWRELGCAAEGAPYVLHALIVQLSFPRFSPFRDKSDAAKALAAAFLDEAHCAGAHGLSEADKAKLKKIAAPAAPQAPKP
jgi:hypothetical protein